MKINLNELLVNSYYRNTETLIVVFDENENTYSFTFANIPDKIKQMNVERFFVASEKLIIISVECVINE